MKEKNMTNTNNESIITYKEKFKPANLPTNNLVDALIEKYKLQNNESTKIALGSFLAYGPNKFKVEQGKYDIEVLMQLLKFGVIYKDKKGLCCAIRVTVEVPLSPDRLIPRPQ